MNEDGGRYGRYLSRNEVLYSNTESDKEAVSLLIDDYMFLKNQSDKTPAKIKLDLIDWISTMSSSTTSQVWNNNDSTRMMEIFHTFGTHFRNTDLISTRWIREHVHTHGGGVSIEHQDS
jgi:hypothetical protein